MRWIAILFLLTSGCAYQRSLTITVNHEFKTEHACWGAGLLTPSR